MSTKRRPPSSSAAGDGAPKKKFGGSNMKVAALEYLVKLGTLIPGPNALCCNYKGIDYRADLLVTGEILYKHTKFQSPSAFSLYIKRCITPSRQADDGWVTVTYNGKALRHFKDPTAPLSTKSTPKKSSGHGKQRSETPQAKKKREKEAREARERVLAHRAAEKAARGIKRKQREEEGNGIEIGSVMESHEEMIHVGDESRRMVRRKVKQRVGVSDECIHFMTTSKWKRIKIIYRDDDDDDDDDAMEHDGDTTEDEKETIHPLFKRHSGGIRTSTSATTSHHTNGYHPMELPPPMTSTSMLMKHLSSHHSTTTHPFSSSLLNANMMLNPSSPEPHVKHEDEHTQHQHTSHVDDEHTHDMAEEEDDDDGDGEHDEHSQHDEHKHDEHDEHDVDESHHNIVYEQSVPISSPALQSSSPALLSMTSPALISMTSPALHATTLTITSLPHMTSIQDDKDKQHTWSDDKEKSQDKKRYLMDEHEDSDGESERGEYGMRKRMKREEKRRTYLSHSHSHRSTLIECEWYRNSESIPYTITCDTNVILVMDIHAHIAETEIIGFLAGDWDPSTRHLTIRAAYPCKTMLEVREHDDTHDEHHGTVEMEPDSEQETCSRIHAANMKVVGWYHSHPTFSPSPSLTDIENHMKYQTVFQDSQGQHGNPFVGCIIAPYNPVASSHLSQLKWFHTRPDKPLTGYHNIDTPMELHPIIHPSSHLSSDLLSHLHHLIEHYPYQDMNLPWTVHKDVDHFFADHKMLNEDHHHHHQHHHEDELHLQPLHSMTSPMTTSHRTIHPPHMSRLDKFRQSILHHLPTLLNMNEKYDITNDLLKSITSRISHTHIHMHNNGIPITPQFHATPFQSSSRRNSHIPSMPISLLPPPMPMSLPPLFQRPHSSPVLGSHRPSLSTPSLTSLTSSMHSPATTGISSFLQSPPPSNNLLQSPPTTTLHLNTPQITAMTSPPLPIPPPPPLSIHSFLI